MSWFILVLARSIPFLTLGFLISLNAIGIADDKMPEKITTVEGITEYSLENGLKILLFQDRSQPKVTVNCTIFVGSRHEGYGEAGMAHLLEHMLFKGTELHPDIPKALKDRGADFNGTTWLDRTNYYETLPANDENIEFAIRLEADRLVNSKILGEDLQKEFSVVRSEFEQGENNPVAVLQQRMFSTAYQWHNYGKSTIGNRSDIERVPVDSLRAFYRKYYRPDNAMLIVAGNFDQDKALAWIQKYFGVLDRPNTPLPQTYTVEPPQDGDRITTVRRVADTQYVGAVYHIPAGSDPLFPAVEILSAVLTDVPAGRLYKAMVETKQATFVAADAPSLHDPGLLTILAQIPKENSIEEARKTMLDTIENLFDQPITDAEVDRIRRQLLNQREMLSAKTQSLAITLSDWAAQGDWRLYFLFRDNLEKTTAADVQQVAQRFLVRNNRTVGIFEPVPAAERIEVPDRPNLEPMLSGYVGREAASEGEIFEPTPQNIESRLIKGKLKTGIPFAMLPKKTRGSTVNVSMNLRFGDEDTLQGKAVAVEMLGPMLSRGTASMPLQEFNDRLDELKANLGVQSRSQALNITIETKRETLLEVLDVVREMLREPAFDPKEFELIRSQTITELESQLQDPQALAPRAVIRALSPFPRGDIRYEATPEEELEDIKALKLEDVKTLHQNFLSGTQGEISVVGDFDPVEVEEKLSAILGNWKSSIPYQRASLSPTLDLQLPIKSIETPDKANSVYFAAQQYAMRDDDPNYPALVMGNYILGGGTLSSRLGDRVRQQEGLSYGVASILRSNPIDEFASLSIYAIANPANRDKLIATIDEEVRKLVKGGIQEDELSSGVQGFLQSQQLSRSRDSALASVLTANLFAGRDMMYYERLERKISELDVETVNDAIAEYIDPDKFIIATAGDFAKPTPVKPNGGKPNAGKQDSGAKP
ncbi:MAG: M16 family metallopeptidase [Pirellula sp.]